MPEGQPRVLVLMATYNGGAWLGEQLSSILAQEDVAVSLEIRDDRSSDQTCEVVRNLKVPSRVHLMIASSSSGSAGANFRSLVKGVDVSQFDYIALADQDDIWLGDKLRTAVEALREQEADGYSSAVEAFWPDGTTSLINQCSNVTRADFLFEGAGQGCTFLMSKRLFLAVQSFLISHPDPCERLHYHDWLIYLVARAGGMKWFFDPRPSMRYRQHGGNEIGARGGVNAAKRRFALIRNGWYRCQIQAAANIYSLLGSPDAEARKIVEYVTPTNTFRPFTGSAKLAYLVARYGRRRMADRAVLVFATLAGWI